MDMTILFGGAGAIVLGGLITVILTYQFQKKLLEQQLQAQEKSHKEFLLFLENTRKTFEAHLSTIADILTKIKVEIHG